MTLDIDWLGGWAADKCTLSISWTGDASGFAQGGGTLTPPP